MPSTILKKLSAFRASGLNLVVRAIVHRNAVYIERAVTHLRKARREIPEHVLKHVPPLSWEHINLTASTPGTRNIRCPKASPP